MKQTDFARLAAISQPMVSKYLSDGRLVVGADGAIDAEASLRALAGHLDEQKRAAALEKLGFLEKTGANRPAPRPVTSAKAEHDEIKRDLARLELETKAGALIPVAVVEERAFDAIAALRQTFESERRTASEELASALGLTPDRAPVIARFLQRLFNKAQGEFVARILQEDAARTVASDMATPAHDAHQVAAE